MERYDLKRKVEALQVVIDDHHKLVRELDVSLNGEDGAAKQSSLCDLVSQIQALQRERDELKELTSVICGHCCEPMAIPSRAVLQAALDAEREKVESYRKALSLISVKTTPWFEGHHGTVEDILAAYAAYVLKQRTLDATTTAPIDAAETHDRMFNHTDRHPEAL